VLRPVRALSWGCDYKERGSSGLILGERSLPGRRIGAVRACPPLPRRQDERSGIDSMGRGVPPVWFNMSRAEIDLSRGLGISGPMVPFRVLPLRSGGVARAYGVRRLVVLSPLPR